MTDFDTNALSYEPMRLNGERRRYERHVRRQAKQIESYLGVIGGLTDVHRWIDSEGVGLSAILHEVVVSRNAGINFDRENEQALYVAQSGKTVVPADRVSYVGRISAEQAKVDVEAVYAQIEEETAAFNTRSRTRISPALVGVQLPADPFAEGPRGIDQASAEVRAAFEAGPDYTWPQQ